jgi:pyroglutamyl-peptidase
MKTILLTGFEPFGGSHINPSIEACKLLEGKEINSYRVVIREIPLRFEELRSSIVKAIEESKPSAVICTGQAGGATTINLERVAINVADARIAYNCGKKPTDELIVEDGPKAFWTTLPIRRMQAALEQAKIPVKVSNSAGTFGCNHIFYEVRHYIEENGLDVPAGFIHVPSLPEQVMERKGPSMSLDLITKGLWEAINTLSVFD